MLVLGDASDFIVLLSLQVRKENSLPLVHSGLKTKSKILPNVCSEIFCFLRHVFT